MAKEFKGFKVVTSANTRFENGFIYFVRTNAENGDGYLQLDGKKYGTGKDGDDAIRSLLGELPSGQTTFAAWIESIQNGGVTGITLNNVDFVVDDNHASATIYGSSITLGSAAKYGEEEVAGAGVSVPDAITGLGTKVKNKIDELSAATVIISGQTDTNRQNIETLSGVVADFSAATVGEIEDLKEEDADLLAEIQEAEKALSGLSGFTFEVAASADTRLDALEAISGNSTVVAVEGTPKVITGVTKTEANGVTTFTLNESDDALVAEVKYGTNPADSGKTNWIWLTNSKGESIGDGFDATDFVKAGLLKSATLVPGPSGTTLLRLVFIIEGGQEQIVDIDVTQLIEIYTADEQSIHLDETADGGTFSAIMDDPDKNSVASYAAFTALSSFTNTLSGYAAAEDVRLQGAIDTLRTDTQTSADTLNTAIANLAISAATSANTLDEKIDALEERAISSGNTLSGLVKTEEERAISAETELSEAIEAEVTRATSAETNLQNQITELSGATSAITEDFLKGVTVNDVTGSVADNVAIVKVTAADTEVGSGLTGTSVTAATTDKTSSVLQSIISALDTVKDAEANDLSSVTSTGKTVTISGTGKERNLEVNLEQSTADTQALGHIEITKTDNGALYGVMYYDGDDVQA